MIKIILPQKQYVPHHGDVEIYGAAKWLAAFGRKEFDSRSVLSLDHFNPNGWNALNELTILCRAEVNDNCRYRCPYTDLRFWSLLPFAIITDNYDQYLPYYVKHDSHTYKWWTDTEWTKKCIMDNEEGDIGGPNLIQNTILGSGYQTGILQSDGSHSVIVVNLELNNGDKIMCYSWEWYNK